jgi:hypothetical protein
MWVIAKCHALVLGDRHPGPGPHEVTIAAQVPLFEQVGVGDAKFQACSLCRCGTQVVGMGDLADSRTDQRRQRPTEHVGERLVGVDDAAVVESNEGHARRRRVERLLEPTPGLLERHGRASTIGDVTQQHHQSGATVAIGHRWAMQARPRPGVARRTASTSSNTT